MIPEHQRPWKPFSVREVAAVFSGAPFFWCIAGGHAIEFAVGREIRAHGDIDLLVLRKDAAAVRHSLSAWDCWMADPPGQLRPWPIDETLPPHAHDVWCRKDTNDDWRFQLMFDESNGKLWQSRRSAQISRPIDAITQTDDAGIGHLVPEIQLFYKARQPRPKDEIDFAAVLPKLSAHQLNWLRDAILTVYGDDHPWFATL
jgi:hypothetical protein